MGGQLAVLAGLGPGQLAPAKGVDQEGTFFGQVQAGAAVDAGAVDAGKAKDVKGPVPPGLRPEAEAPAARLVGLLVAGAEQAGQRAAGVQGQEPALLQESAGLFQSSQCELRRKPAAPAPLVLKAG